MEDMMSENFEYFGKVAEAGAEVLTAVGVLLFAVAKLAKVLK